MGQIVHDLADIHRRHSRAPPRALEGPGQGDVAAVTGPRRYHMSLNPGAGQRQVPHDVRRLVPHELVRPAQFAPVHDAAIVQHDRIGLGRALDESARLQLRDLMGEAERPGRRQLRREALRRHIVRSCLPPDQRMRPLDRYRQPKRLGGGDHVGGVLIRDRKRRLHGQHGGLAADRGGLGLCQRVEVWLHAAVENRRLGTRELDRQIVDQVRGNRGEQMLDGMDRRGAMADRRATLHRFHFGESRGHFGFPGEIDAAKHDALPRRRGQKCRLRDDAGV